jgi:hypothetical protein
MADALAGLFAEKSKTTARATAEAALGVALSFDQMASVRDDGAWLGIDIAIAAQVAGVVIDDGLLLRWPRQLAEVARHEFAVVLDLRRRAVFLPVFLNRTNAVGADGDNFLHLILSKVLEIRFGKLLKEQIIAKASNRIACAFFFPQDSKTRAEIAHDAGEVGDNLAAFGIVAAHAAKPEAVLLRAIKNGELLLLDELFALSGLHTESIGAALETKKEFGAVVVFPCAGVDRATAQANEYGQMLNANRTLELTRAAGGALKWRNEWVVLAKERLRGRGSEFVQVAAQSQDDFLWVERLAGVGCGAVFGATAALYAGVRLQGDEAREVRAGDEAEVFIACERRDATKAATREEYGGGAEDQVEMFGVGNNGQEDQQSERVQPPEHGNCRAARGNEEGGEVGDHQKKDEKSDETGFPGEFRSEPARPDQEPANEEAKDADGAAQSKCRGEPEVKAPPKAVRRKKANPEAHRSVVQGNQDEGAESPEDKGMGQAREWPLADDFGLAEDLGNELPNAAADWSELEIGVLFRMEDAAKDRPESLPEERAGSEGQAGKGNPLNDGERCRFSQSKGHEHHSRTHNDTRLGGWASWEADHHWRDGNGYFDGLASASKGVSVANSWKIIGCIQGLSSERRRMSKRTGSPARINPVPISEPVMFSAKLQMRTTQAHRMNSAGSIG